MRVRVVSPAADPLAYPGRAPRRSWILDGARVRWLDDGERLDGAWREHTPVLAIGSNRRPGRLAEHLAGCPGPVAGLRVLLRGADVVYPSHVAAYGVVTATIVPCPEAAITAWLLLLDASHLARLAPREAAFDLHELAGTTVTTPHIEADTPLAFVCRHGPLLFADGRPRRLWRVLAAATPLRRASLAAAHRRAAHLLDAPGLRWPLAPEDALAADRRLAGLGGEIGWS